MRLSEKEHTYGGMLLSFCEARLVRRNGEGFWKGYRRIGDLGPWNYKQTGGRFHREISVLCIPLEFQSKLSRLLPDYRVI